MSRPYFTLMSHLGNENHQDQASLQCEGLRSPQRIMLYSHDTMGLGHFRRNILIASTLKNAYPESSICLISGIRAAASYNLPKGIEVLMLPAVNKSEITGAYIASHLNMGLEELIGMRMSMIHAAVTSFNPDLFISDNVPWGLKGELSSALSWIKEHSQAKCVLGLRDVLDAPETVSKEWTSRDNLTAIHRYYDSIWVYGDQNLFDLSIEYGFSKKISSKMLYTGYLQRQIVADSKETHSRDIYQHLGIEHEKVVLCTLGGGQDGEGVAKLFLNAHLPEDMSGVLVTGPFMPESIFNQLSQIAKTKRNVMVTNFHPEMPKLISAASKVVSMGGYNTVSEILTYGTDAMIVPRVRPRKEQLVRAHGLKKLGLVDYLHPDEFEKDKLDEWLLSQELERNIMTDKLDFHGLSRIPKYACQLMSEAI